MGRPVKKNLIASNESSVALSFQLGFLKTHFMYKLMQARLLIRRRYYKHRKNKNDISAHSSHDVAF